MSAAISVNQTVTKWGNGLALRITAPVARAARFSLGQPIRLEVINGVLQCRPVGKPKLTLSQKLKAFDPKLHGGEVMASDLVGSEVF